MGKRTEKTVQVVRKMSDDNNLIRCACNKKPCEGICRKTNLNRKRQDGNPCPSAYIPPKKRRERRYREDD